jgi:hypothetical protein
MLTGPIDSIPMIIVVGLGDIDGSADIRLGPFW